MTVTDIARRVYNHNWKLDPIIRSLLDTDFYKLLMLQMIWKCYPDVNATFSLINRSPKIKLSQEINIKELQEQLDHARTLRFSKKEMLWLTGNTFYGQNQIFHPDFLEWLQDFQLPDYELSEKNGDYILNFPGSWSHTTMWEIPALAIVNELRSRAILKEFGMFSLDIVYARAKAKMWSKVERLRTLKDLQIADFGTRRRHSFLWQAWCVEALKEGLGDLFKGTSNVLLAMNHDLNPIGTNAHELYMVAAALSNSDNERLCSPYKVMEDWQSFYQGNLLIALPDTFGTDSFLKHAPDWVANWKGFRPDSAPPIEGGEKLINWWKSKNKNPLEKSLIFSDALDVDAIEKTYHHFNGRVQMSFGWGTNLTNDFVGCTPQPMDDLSSISLVCKVNQANGRSAVKLSDTPQKSTGNKEEITRYKKLFNEKN